MRFVEEGRELTISLAEAMILKMYEQAMSGDFKAIQQWARLHKERNDKEQRHRGSVLLVPELSKTYEEWRKNIDDRETREAKILAEETAAHQRRLQQQKTKEPPS